MGLEVKGLTWYRAALTAAYHAGVRPPRDRCDRTRPVPHTRLIDPIGGINLVRLVSIHGATTNAEPVPCTEGIPRRSLVRSSSSVIVSEWASVSGRCREIAGARNYPAWLPPDSAPALGPSRNEPSASRKSSGRSICGRWPQSRMTTRRPHQRMNEPGAAALPRPPAAGYRLYRGVRFSRKACIPSTPSGCATQSTNP